MKSAQHPYPIGTPGVPWGSPERTAWLARLSRKRSYAADVLAVQAKLGAGFEVLRYGHLDFDPDRYPLIAYRSRAWRDELPIALVTGGVHGYETSGVHGALRFLERHAADYQDRANLLVAPCVSPWGYETIQRWNMHAVDPNRSFGNGAAQESAALMQLVAPLRERVLVHIDLHETTDSDEHEFRPALAARDGKPFEPDAIPDGFYVVDDVERPQTAFQNAVIAAVSRVTRIAEPDANGRIIGTPMVAPGVIQYALKRLGLCAGFTAAPFKTTTEVYPDSPRTSPEECNVAQAAAVCAAIDFALESRPA
ncbi:MAG: M14 family metallopeptidase [Woeseiaceae bacterium]